MNNTSLNKNMVTLTKNERKVRVEEEVVFPDYSSDIVKIIRTDAVPYLTSKKVRIKDGNAILDLSGRVDFNVIYTGDEGSAESYRFSRDFSDSVKAPVAPDTDGESVVAQVALSADNVSCKAQSPRKVTARCDVTVQDSIKCNSVFESLSPEKDENTEKLSFESTSAEILSSVTQEFDFSEEIKLPASYPPMEKIISCRTGISLDNTSVSDGVVRFWGTMWVFAVYLPEYDGEKRPLPQSFYQPIEISGKLEADDATDRSAAVGSLITCGTTFEIITDNMGENRILKIDGSYLADFIIIENVPCNLVRDAYAVGCKSQPLTDTKSFVKYEGALRETLPFRERITLKEGVESLEDCHADVKLRGFGFENGKMFADTRLVFKAIGSGDTGETGINEVFDLRLPMNLPSELADKGEDILPEISVYTGYIDSKVTGDGAEISFDVTMSVEVFTEAGESFVSSLDVTESISERVGSIFYYPASSDSMWSIGKRYAVSQRALTDANGEIKRVMLIP